MKVILACLFILFGTSSALFRAEVAKPVDGPDGEYCSGQALNELLNILLNVGVEGTCGDVCSQLPNSLEGAVCDILCLYVGFDEFINLLDYEDPDPIYACEIIGTGAATSGAYSVSPTSGAVGTTFTFSYSYTVTSQTSTGLASIALWPVSGFGLPISDAELIANGQAPGTYNIQFTFQAEPSEWEPMSPGPYTSEVAICAGDCTGAHEDSGVYCQAIANFTITGNQTSTSTTSSTSE